MHRTILYGLLGLFLTFGALTRHMQAEDGEQVRTWGRGFFAPGVVVDDWGSSASYFAMGVGGEGRLGDAPVLLSLDLAWLAPYRSLGNGFGEFCPGLGYSFGSGRTQPFINGGYTLFFREGTASGLFFGGGVNHWINDHVGIGFEARDAVAVIDGTAHFIQFRANVLFH